ncbi:TPA: O187 family O-antigen polymerase [Escherichia coli]|nr:O187 family O-antigen polymerase [Escherichia coli]
MLKLYKNKAQEYYLLICLFLCVFNFYVPSVGPALYISIAMVFVYLVVNIKSLCKYNSVISRAYVSYIFIYGLPFLFLICFVGVRTILSGSGDTSFLFLLIKYFVFGCVASLFAVAIFISSDITSLSDVQALFYRITLVQSLIIIAAVLSPSISEFVRLYQNNDANNSSLVLEGLRGVALSSMQFYSLACYFCIITILLADDFINNKIGYLKTSVFLLLMAISSIFISRTAIIGVLLFFVYTLNPFIKYGKKRSVAMALMFLVLTLVFLLFSGLIFTEQVSIIQQKVLPWAFELIYRYSETGSFSTASTDELKSMYFSLNEITMLIGDGKYTGDTPGTYYMGTDAGYMRPTLFGGFFLILAMLVIWILWLKNTFYPKKGGVLFISLVILSLILQYKGEFIITNYCTLILLSTLLMVSQLLKQKFRG